MTSAIPEELAYTASPEILAGRVADAVKPTETSGQVRSVRTDRYEDHDITVTSVHEVIVDGVPVDVRLTVDDAGMVHSPGLPYRRFTSALEAVRALISAHRGPVFLAWHRMMLLYLEGQCQGVLGSNGVSDKTFGLPYWDWSVDGDDGSSPTAPIWQPTSVGGQGMPVSDGPFAYRPGDPNSFAVRIESAYDGKPSQADGGQGRGLMRHFGSGWKVLPTGADVKNALAFGPSGPTPNPGDRYDVLTYSIASDGFRGRLEGWTPNPDPNRARPWLHNQVHAWIGGDMSPASSPNDPVFFLHHCNVDRIRESWLQRYNRVYAPDGTASDYYSGERIDDALDNAGFSTSIRTMLDRREYYAYDVLP
ncbi:tyrosinase family protein [Streptomyces sp. NPDC059556]|uniref:tyrosinase family protein n=1 Tax=Streptomyces sp. NPDC059556 TaxID=3346863 RepID=UPI0036C52EE1